MLQDIIVYDTGFHVVQSEKGFRTCILLIPVDVAKFDTCKKPRSVCVCVYICAKPACLFLMEIFQKHCQGFSWSWTTSAVSLTGYVILLDTPPGISQYAAKSSLIKSGRTRENMKLIIQRLGRRNPHIKTLKDHPHAGTQRTTISRREHGRSLKRV